MVVLQYPALLEEDDNSTWRVTFPDFDDAVTFGETRTAALEHAVTALETVIASRMKRKLDIPTPGAAAWQAAGEHPTADRRQGIALP